MTRILVVDDDPQILRTLRINLRARGYDVDIAADGTTALRLATARHPDLLLLDLGLPDTDGVDVITNLRTWATTPIIVLSGRSGSTDKVEALDAGADDYVTKPFGIEELLARIRAATRRTVTTSAVPAVKIGRYTVHLTDRQVRDDDGNPVRLTPTEWRILEILATNPGKLISQTQLLTQVWGPTYTHETHYLRQYLAQLRRKLEADPARPQHLLTELGMGYRLQEGD
ncbi:response regulator [Paractinoplanes brasiliensis]|uniref:Two-component system KDP operon response regulator KdpE n=1 Tax=Paractinoplanes brasiliensis TaxID=52695 RepID=A0A4V3C7Z3_9ACTN|nr:response regulator [Actinoplanes brasiliensis]TDO39658.1 two-component system KDP operon response regulator KdpE [Actinoplanes brasiliensis]GID29003.1 putative transcriptional regulatory protein KdpE [Actinoplanes brasiliensis]